MIVAMVYRFFLRKAIPFYVLALILGDPYSVSPAKVNVAFGIALLFACEILLPKWFRLQFQVFKLKIVNVTISRPDMQNRYAVTRIPAVIESPGHPAAAVALAVQLDMRYPVCRAAGRVASSLGASLPAIRDGAGVRIIGEQ